MRSLHLARNIEALARTGGPASFFRELGRAIEGLDVKNDAISDERQSAAPALDVPPDGEVLFLGAAGVGPFGPLLERTRGRLVLVEPDLERLAGVLAREDLSAAIGDRRFVVYPSSSPASVLRLWEAPAGARALSKLLVIDGAGDGARADRRRREFFARVREGIAARERDRALDTGAAIALGPLAVANALENLARPIPALDGRIFDALRGRPAVIASAGPSLDRAAGPLLRFRSRAVVIAVDTAVKPLRVRGVTPDIALGVDPRERNVHNLEGAELDETFFIAEASAHPKLLALATAGTALVLADNPVGRALDVLGSGVPRLEMFGSVATAAFELACRMGLDPIVFIGQDLAFPGGKRYCENTDGRAVEVPPDSELRTEPDLDGRPVRTTLRLLAFRDWLTARMAERPETTFVNASEAGILRDGAQRMPPEKAFERYLTEELAVRDTLRSLFRSDGRPLKRARGRLLGEISRRVDTCLRILGNGDRGRPRDVLERYLRHEAVVALVEVLEPGPLLELSARFEAASESAKNDVLRALLETLFRGVTELKVMLVEAGGPE